MPVWFKDNRRKRSSFEILNATLNITFFHIARSCVATARINMHAMKLLVCTLLFLIITSVTSDNVYIVYMGGKGTSKSGSLREDQARLMYSLQNRTVVVHVYKHGFTGFAVHASEEEAKLLAAEPGVLSVFPDKTVPLHTTRSWTFLEHQHYFGDSISATSHSGSTANGSDIIIGVIDSGIWPESKSFADEGMGPVPERWRGTCEETKDFPASSCNRKIIGARNFDKHNQTCRGFFGHGSHTASIAAGAAVAGVSYYGLAAGTAIGGSPNFRIAVYKACQSLDCSESAILAAMDAAIHDGVDIMSLSLGEADTDIRTDPVAIGGFHAVEHGIMVVCSAGNLGPTSSSVVNFAPWLTTVGASSIDRQFVAGVVLGNNEVIKGSAIQFSHLCESPTYPLIDGVLAKINGSKDSASRNPTATILKSETILGYKPALVIADFSSRGPPALAPNILKPDITAPGVNIIAAWSKVESRRAIPGKDLPDYVLESGTSMSCPHISGVAALVKSQHPTWDHSAIRSAIMTTAVQKNTAGAPIRKLPGLQKATPYDFGAGEVNTAQVTNPGLVYETTAIDYYNFLCNYGYNLSTIRLIAKDIPRGFSCPKDADADLISNMNYPSIAVSKFKHGTQRIVTRTVTNVGDEEDTVYTVTVDPPASKYLNVQVIPKKLHFTKENKKQSFEVIFSTDYPYESPVFGWITWSNDQHRVRSPFVLTVN
ncbi:CO(2)-response secreted protease [Daucus carota subsp. sativus]|uniref:CO(2)-response secreted protease n=1 Tax=Daucus carota subsp. sativus TaxID=79200 RepID=UPI0007F0198F|nr:PREDICTED: CO(2)-response secreted protease-like [Daucus carota subsp. sativus]